MDLEWTKCKWADYLWDHINLNHQDRPWLNFYVSDPALNSQQFLYARLKKGLGSIVTMNTHDWKATVEKSSTLAVTICKNTLDAKVTNVKPDTSNFDHYKTSTVYKVNVVNQK